MLSFVRPVVTKKMSDTSINFKDLEGSDSISESSFSSAHNWDRKTVECLPLQPHELQSLENKLNRIIFIQQSDQSYHWAINDIRDQTEISMLVEPSFYGRHGHTSVIVIATANNTYVFDVRALGSIFKELSALLEAEVPRKIMHCSHRICDLLCHKHKLKINGICDTFVALCVVQQDRTICTLRNAISIFFDIPLSELTCDEIDGESESRRNFTARPLSQGQLKYLGKLAILQRKLFDRLIFGNICKELQLMSENFSREFDKNRNSAQVAMDMAPRSRSGFDRIDQFYKISTQINKQL